MGGDSELSPEFWRSHPHVFIASRWERKYCRVCHRPKQRKIHDVKHQDADSIGTAHLTDYRINQNNVIYAVEGWNDSGGSCSYGGQNSYVEALEFYDALMKSPEGRKYDHYSIAERLYYVTVDTNIVMIGDD